LNKIKITADSTCDVLPNPNSEDGVDIINLSVVLGDEVVSDGASLDHKLIYDYVNRTGKVPTTSAPNVSDYISFFKKWRDKGYEVVHLSLSSELSASYQNSRIAAEAVGGVHTVDSHNVSGGIALLINHAKELLASGMSAMNMSNALTAAREKIKLYVILDKLDFLYKGGRCSALKLWGANILRVKPIVLMDGGKVELVGKARGVITKTHTEFIDFCLKGKDVITDKVYLPYSECSAELLAAAKEKLSSYGRFKEILTVKTGGVLTCHCGPNVLGVAYMEK
jgi:DegV family protein with EDD domain